MIGKQDVLQGTALAALAPGLQMKRCHCFTKTAKGTRYVGVSSRPAVSLHVGERGAPLKLGAAEFPFCTASGVTPSSTVATCMQSSSHSDNSAQPLV